MLCIRVQIAEVFWSKLIAYAEHTVTISWHMLSKQAQITEVFCPTYAYAEYIVINGVQMLSIWSQITEVFGPTPVYAENTVTNGVHMLSIQVKI